MKPHQIGMLVSGAIVVATVAFVVHRWRNPPPPPPSDALVVLPGKRIGAFTLGMSRAQAEAAGAHAGAEPDALDAGLAHVRLRDGKVVGVSSSVGAAGVDLDGAWIAPAVDPPHTARALAGSLHACPEKKRAGGVRFECYGTRFDADASRLVIAIGTEAE